MASIYYSMKKDRKKMKINKKNIYFKFLTVKYHSKKVKIHTILKKSENISLIEKEGQLFLE